MLRSSRMFYVVISTLLMTSALKAQVVEPKSYDCYRTNTPLRVDGKLDDPAWRDAPWTTDFVDIEDSTKPTPRFRTRTKILWDDDYLYIGAELEEPEVKATLTRHDSVIFHDNDFEMFLKPLADASGYFEFEINAQNTSWDLYLNKPYRQGGKADSSWDIPGLKTAVNIQGTLNDPSDKDSGWTVEIAIPWNSFASRLNVTKPEIGSEWRVNFSRVEWKAGQPKEDNWVWSPQGVVNMHVPERWGHLVFQESRRSGVHSQPHTPVR
ncbi:carbohydrate-binding family 9-like protein [Granulicella sp. dw_53]|uniref:carbohydrate-binding family 9-like protein n=1 Tax=Granulicella sp. dw_53 TaxID=2719792 RepID=UPI001BD30A8D|nr:carbohydrate-binding family 9-like protein [Granulicella sp. dw_53]